jgi:TPR repeat protein
MNNEDKSALAYARSWVRRSPGPDAWSNLAAVYATKEPPDLKLARSWYRRAALKEHKVGLFEYGLMLIQGEGGPRRPAQGRRYLERAAALGNINALKVLAYALSKGGYSYQPSSAQAKPVKRALRRALSRAKSATRLMSSPSGRVRKDRG